MLKKYLPYFALLAAGFLLWFIKKNQPSSYPKNSVIHIPVSTSNGNKESLNRNVHTIIYSKHARCRMDCRHISEAEVREILIDGQLNTNKIETSLRGKTYPLEGVTADKQHVRIVFAPKGSDAVEVVTCIDLDTEWPCNCQ